MNVLSLFSGIGGLELGLERAGMTVVGQVEIDPFCRNVLAKHWPEVPKHDDVRSCVQWWRSEPRPPVHVVCGGFPCQPVSVAGRRRAQEDDRWLWPAFAEVVRGLRPDFALVENVPGLLAHGMGDVLGDLAELGYDAEWDCVSAAFVGAPHIRRRVFAVAYPAGRGGQRGRFRPETPGGAGASGLPAGSGQAVADAGSGRHGSPRRVLRPGWHSPFDGGWWLAEPDVGRVAHGIPKRVDRLRALGNAVVPQVAQYVGELILEAGGVS